MAAKRTVKCSNPDCGRIWDSTAKPDNLKCKDCKGTDIEDNYIATPEPEPKKKEVAEAPKVCSRCNGDGIYHSNKTGIRAKTSTEPLVDPSRPCPDCGGK